MMDRFFFPNILQYEKLSKHQQMYYSIFYAYYRFHSSCMTCHLQGADTKISLKETTVNYLFIFECYKEFFMFATKRW
jgi:hypothetical protein